MGVNGLRLKGNDGETKEIDVHGVFIAITAVACNLQNYENNIRIMILKQCKKRHQQDLNLRGGTPTDFKSVALTTRPRCLLRHLA